MPGRFTGVGARSPAERFYASGPHDRVGDVTMCHHYESTSWWSERTDDEETVDAEDDDWTPDGFEEDRDVEVELVTDGGDGDEA
jgi:hypothetical protein